MTAGTTKASVRDASLLLQLSATPQLLKRRAGSGRHVRLLGCGTCRYCLRKDCGRCRNCLDKPKYGGEGKKKQACLTRQCVSPALSYACAATCDS